MTIAGTKCHRYTVMTGAFRCLTRCHRCGLASSGDTMGSAARSSPTWAAANASSAIDGGFVLPEPTISTMNDPHISKPASRAAPPAAITNGRHHVDVRVRSCQAKPHWWIEPHTNR